MFHSSIKLWIVTFYSFHKKKAPRIITNSSYRDHTKPCFINIKIYKLMRQSNYFFHNLKNKPEYISESIL